MSVRDRVASSGLVEVVRTHVAEPRLKVLFVTSMWPDHARPHYGTFVASQARSLEAHGIGVDVLAIRGYLSTRAYVTARPRLVHLIRQITPDVVHVHTGHAATIGLPRIPVPKVVSFVGGDLLGHPTGRGISHKSRLEAAVFRQLAHLADATITKSDEMERMLPASLRHRNHVIPNGVDLNAFRPGDRSTARRQLGWNRTERVALFLGDPLDPRKNVRLAEEAIGKLRDRGLDVRLHVGWGARPDDVPSLMAASDALVFPSLSEGSPNVVKEAMACSLPVVATPVGDIKARLSGVDGCFVVAFTPQAMADGLERAIALPGAPAARDAVRTLALASIASRVERVYDVVVKVGLCAQPRIRSLAPQLSSRTGAVDTDGSPSSAS